MVIGALTARNIKVKRERVRAPISRVDPAEKFGIPVSAHLIKKIFTASKRHEQISLKYGFRLIATSGVTSPTI